MGCSPTSRTHLTSLRAKVVTGVLVLLAGLLPVEFATSARGVITGSGDTTARSAKSPAVTFARYFFGYDYINSPAVQAKRWPLLIAQSNQDAAARQVKAANPARVTTVFYVNPLFLRESDPDGITTAVRNSDAFANHPEWFLLDSAGNRIPATAFNNRDYAADISSSSYLSAAVSFLLARIDSQGWDGVFLDDTNPTPDYTFSTRPAKFPTDTSWQNAELTLVDKICGAVRAAGKRCYLNLGQRNTSWAEAVAQESTGPMNEFFIALNPAANNGQSVATIENGRWLDQMSWAAWAEANTTQQIAHAWTTDPAVTTYALASYLLISQGKGAFSAGRNYASAEEGRTYPRSFSTAGKLGRATGSYVADQAGVYYRTFTRGTVVVNPHTTTRTFNGVSYAPASGTITLN